MNSIHEAAATAPADPAAGARLRSGTAARLAGLPVTTLRVWERRYGVVAAPKTASGQRLYGTLDVQRLRLLKRLTDGGHAIGMLAALPLAALQSLAAGIDDAPAAAPAARRRVWVVGRAAARRLRGLASVAVTHTDDDLDAALAASAPVEAVDVLLVQRASLQPGDPARLAALRQRAGAEAALVVLYAFGAEALAEQLRASGARVHREPASGRDLARLVGADRVAAPAWSAEEDVPGRRYSDETLAALAEMPSTVACECPRHLAEIVMQLAGFERYSADCTARGPADAALHRELSALAGQARSRFEAALARVVAEEGLEPPV